MMIKSSKQKCKTLGLATLVVLAMGFQGCSKKTPDEHIAAAIEFQNNGNASAAVVELKNAIQLDPKLASARFELGKIYIEQNKFEAAEKELNRAMELGYSASKVIPLLSRAYQRTGANAALETIDHDMEGLTTVEKAEVGFFKAQSLLQLGKTDEASLLLEDLVQLDTASAYRGLSEVLQLIIADNTEQALNQAIQLQEQAPLNKDVLNITARLYMLNDQASSAADVYSKYVKAAPEDIETRFALANMLVELNRTEEAEVHIDELLKINDQNPLLNQLKAIVRAAQKDFANAQSFAEVAVANGRADPVVRLVAGYSAYQQADFDGAILHLSTIASSLPDNHPGLRILAASQLQSGQTQAASEVLGRLSDLSGDDALLFSKTSFELLQSGNRKKAAEIIQRTEGISESADDLTRLGVLKLSVNDLDGILDLEGAVAKSPESITAKTTLATAYLGTGQLDKAQTLAQQWKEESVDKPDAYLLAGEVALRRNDLALAESEFLTAQTLAPNDSSVAMSLVGLDVRNQDTGAALLKLSNIIERDGSFIPALTAFYAIKAQQGEPEEGMAPALTSFEQDNSNSSLAVLVARMYASQADHASSLEVLNSIAADSQAPAGYWSTKGIALLRSGQQREATQHYERWIELEPNNRDAVLGQLLLHDNQNQFKEGLALTKRFLAARDDKQVELLQSYFLIMSGDVAEAQALLDTFEEEIQALPFVRGVKARIQLRQGDAKGAIDNAKAAYEENKNTKNLLVLERAYTVSGEQESAYSLLEQHNANNPNDLRALMLLAEKDIGKDVSTAIERYKTALELNQNNFIALNNLAYLYMEEGQLEQAADYGGRAFKLQPNNVATADTQAQILIRQEKLDEAIAIYNRVMTDEVDNEQIVLNYVEALLKSGNQVIAKRRLEGKTIKSKAGLEKLERLKAQYNL